MAESPPDSEELSRDDLTDEERGDIEATTAARDEAYAPYFNFSVGAGIRTNDGEFHVGWNVENCAGLILHAEDNAIGSISRKSRESGIKRITIVGGPTEGGSETPIAPCGSCRQKLLEFLRTEDDPDVVMAGTRGNIRRMKLKDMVPLPFYPALLDDGSVETETS